MKFHFFLYSYITQILTSALIFLHFIYGAFLVELFSLVNKENNRDDSFSILTYLCSFSHSSLDIMQWFVTIAAARYMSLTLPKFRKQTRKIFVKTSPNVEHVSFLLIPKLWSYLTLSLAMLCLILVIVIGSQSGFGFISPVSSFLNPLALFSQEKKVYNTFAYIPGWSDTKYDDVVMDDIDILAFFDLAVKGDGSIDEDTKGYTKFHSEEAAELFKKAKQKDIKVVVTLTQYNSANIEKILDNKKAQQKLITDSVQEVKEAGIDGVAIDFTYKKNNTAYKAKYNTFIADFIKEMKSQIPSGEVDISFNGNPSAQVLLDLPTLERISDTLLVSMDKVALLEEKHHKMRTPLYAYNEELYWKDVDNAFSEVSHYLMEENVAIEKAWYGNGEEYPMYKPVRDKIIGSTRKINTLSTPLQSSVIDELTAQVPKKTQPSVRKNLPYIAKALEDEGILTANVLAYALATVEHETAGTFEPIDEIAGEKNARRFGYEGGNNYYGRGFIQLTHLRNYRVMGERIGMGDALAKNPDLTSDPQVAAKILAAFFVDNGPARLASQGDFIAARRPVNPDAYAYSVANLAMKFRYTM